ncbi:MAG: SecDF P1 head subdomain-containing protein [Mycobacteriales bacterium]
MIAARPLVVIAAAAAALAACGGGNGATAPVRSSNPAEVTMTVTPVGEATPAQLSAAARALGTRLSALGVAAHVVSAGGALRVSGGSELRVAVYAAEFPGVLSFREIRSQAGGSPPGSGMPTPTGTGGTGPTVTGLDAASDEPAQTAPSASTLAQFAALDCAEADNGRPSPVDEDPHHFVVACDSTGQTKYLLTPADIVGTQVASATATEGQTSLGGQHSVWEVDLTFRDSAVSQMEQVSTRLYHNNKQQLAITVDGVVLSAPSTNGVLGKNITISGGAPPFSKTEAQALAAVVSSGPLPVARTLTGPG